MKCKLKQQGTMFESQCPEQMRGMTNSIFLHSCREGRLGWTFWKAVWKCESKVFSLAILLLDLSLHNQNAQLFICMNAYFGLIYNSKNLEAVCVFENRELINSIISFICIGQSTTEPLSLILWENHDQECTRGLLRENTGYQAECSF